MTLNKHGLEWTFYIYTCRKWQTWTRKCRFFSATVSQFVNSVVNLSSVLNGLLGSLTWTKIQLVGEKTLSKLIQINCPSHAFNDGCTFTPCQVFRMSSTTILKPFQCPQHWPCRIRYTIIVTKRANGWAARHFQITYTMVSMLDWVLFEWERNSFLVVPKSFTRA